MTGVFRHWMAFGTGAGIEISGPRGEESLHAALVRVRPGSARVLDEFIVDDAQSQAGVWGMNYAKLLRKHGMGHVAATVLLPRRDVIVRQLALPGVSEKDLASAVSFQLDGLHPYPEDDAQVSWARLPNTSSILVVITRRSVVEHYASLFAEAGVKVGSFTCSAAAIYSALRLFNGIGERKEILAYAPAETGIEIYGESATRPIFSAAFETSVERSAAMAAAELRLSPDIVLHGVDALLGVRSPLPYSAALDSACPALGAGVNLLPEPQRQSSSRTIWVPAAVLAASALLLTVALGAFPTYGQRRYDESLQAEIARVSPGANRAAELDRKIAVARQQAASLDDLRSQSKADMDVLGELTKILPPPTWLNSLEVSRAQVTLAGETSQAAPLLGIVDGSPLFAASEFASAPVRVKDGEAFRIRTNRAPEGAR